MIKSKATEQAAKASATTGAASLLPSGEDSTVEKSAATFEVDEGSNSKQRGGGGVRVVIFRTLDDPESSKCAAVIGGFIMLLIFLGSLTFVLESLPDVKERWSSEMAIFEAACVGRDSKAVDGTDGGSHKIKRDNSRLALSVAEL